MRQRTKRKHNRHPKQRRQFDIRSLLAWIRPSQGELPEPPYEERPLSRKEVVERGLSHAVRGKHRPHPGRFLRRILKPLERKASTRPPKPEPYFRAELVARQKKVRERYPWLN